LTRRVIGVAWRVGLFMTDLALASDFCCCNLAVVFLEVAPIERELKSLEDNYIRPCHDMINLHLEQKVAIEHKIRES
jgi:hypothetical protein